MPEMTPELIAEIEAEFRASTLPPYGRPRNAHYVMNARKNFPLLLAEVERLRAENAELRKPPANAAWESVVTLAYKIGGDDMRNIQSITGHYVVMREENAELRRDRERLDWLDSVNQKTNERNQTAYGWEFEMNHNRAALTDHNFPPRKVREAIDLAIQYAAMKAKP